MWVTVGTVKGNQLLEVNLTALITLQNSQQDPIEDVEEGEQEQEEAEAKLKKSPRKVAASKKPIAGNLLHNL